MRSVKSRDTRPEMAVRRMIHKLGFRFRLHRADLPGRPDLTLPRWGKVIFVHGCFWHGHQCRRGRRVPISNREYWVEKIRRNRERDQSSRKDLLALGWEVLVIWECDLASTDSALAKLKAFLGTFSPLTSGECKNH
ncbi:MAG: DNA mismatch endonuclease Vsr [Acidobacteriaceae bacterium]|jgi:DNA mismatch endonuclease (patch repair protein)|nr:DNA mismatch endonuclease Vsr [Acidobacteriaceae bacterium]